MPKKKKSQLKPVERGFATSSIPKKTATTEENVHPVEEPPLIDKGNEAPLFQINGPSTGIHEIPRFETDRIVGFLDKYQDKTDRDVTRFLKNVEFECSLSQTYEKLELFSVHTDSVLKLIEGPSHHSPSATYSEDKVMPQLGMIYGVLRKLGIDEERVLQCLRIIGVLDIDSAYEWLCRHSSEEDLRCESLKEHDVIKPFLSSVQQFYFHILAPTPSSINPVLSPLSEQVLSKTDRALPTIDVVKFDEYYDPNAEYARLKTCIYEFENSQTDDGRGNLEQLRSRLFAVQNDYCFRKREGEALFLAKKSEVDARLLEEKLAGYTKVSLKKTSDVGNQSSSSSPKVVTDIFDGEIPEEGNGIFGMLLDGPPESEVIEGIQVRIQDMALPKGWTGRTAKPLLLTVVKQLDRLAVVSHRILPTVRAGIAKRAAVSVRWKSGFVGEWCMAGIGGYTVEQAEEYISTVALHGLSYPHSGGFVTASTSNVSSMVQANIRFFPPFFRDLWDELEAQRKDAERTENCRIWSLLCDIYEQRRVVDGLITPKLPITSSTVWGKDRPRPGIPRLEKDVEDLYYSRRNSAAHAAMFEERKKLPIASYREEILAMIDASRVVVLSGDTGCGKSTQVPSFILEEALSKGNHCKIYCAEPRRISTVSLAQRVSAELGDPPASVGTPSSLVGYSIRLESTTSRTSRLIFATYGIILRMLEKRHTRKEGNALFDDVTHIIIDEVHERSLDSDFLLIVLKSLMEANQNLKLVLMSATLNAQKLSEFFGKCPVIMVPGRTFPVDVHFLEDAIEYTNWSIDGDSILAKRAGAAQNRKSLLDTDLLLVDDIIEDDQQISLEKRYSHSTQTTITLLDERQIPYDLIIRLLERLCFEDHSFFQYSKAVLVFMPGLAEIRRLHDMLSEHDIFGVEEKFQIYPLHSTVTNEQQSSAFDLLPAGRRKIVISTNIAETGVTIPDITCVIDTGKHREMRYDEKRHISRLVDSFITKSNAKQRRGRAGRVQPGLCFHLFTKSRYENYMQEDPIPEMLRLSLAGIALQIKTMDLNLGSSIEDVFSRALDPPLETNVQRAVQALIEAKALSSNQDITPMGRLLSRLPTDIRLGKVLLSAVVFGCLDPALTVAAALNSKSPFTVPFGMEQQVEKARKSFQIDNSDFLTIHNAFSSWRNTCSDPSYARKFCRENFLSFHNLQQIEDLRQQFFGYLVESGFIRLPPDGIDRFSKVRFGRNKTRFVDIPLELNSNSNNTNFINAALLFGLYPKLLLIDSAKGQLRTLSNNQVTYFHPSSINMGKRLIDFPGKFLCYFTIMQTKKVYAWETGPVDNLALALLCGDCEFKLITGSVIIDHKIKFKLSPKACVALKQLRQQFNNIMNLKMRSAPLSAMHIEWYNLTLSIISRINPDRVNSELLIS